MTENNRENIVNFGEVYSPHWLIDKMLSLVADEASRIESTFLEPSCGDGRILYAVLEKKLDYCKRVYARNPHHKLFFSFVSLTTIYGIDIQPKNVDITREKLLKLFLYGIKKSERLKIMPAAKHVLSKNILLANTVSSASDTAQLLISKWSPLGTSHIQRQDFYFSNLLSDKTSGAGNFNKVKATKNIVTPVNVPFKSRQITDLILDA